MDCLVPFSKVGRSNPPVPLSRFSVERVSFTGQRSKVTSAGVGAVVGDQCTQPRPKPSPFAANQPWSVYTCASYNRVCTVGVRLVCGWRIVMVEWQNDCYSIAEQSDSLLHAAIGLRPASDCCWVQWGAIHGAIQYPGILQFVSTKAKDLF